MKKKRWIILIIVVVVFGILGFFLCKLRSYAKNTMICNQQESGCTALRFTEYYNESGCAGLRCPTFWEYLIKGIESLNINSVPDCCDRGKDRACKCGGKIIKNGRACDCGSQPILD